mgnify:CR=1 FL=1
MEQIFFVMLNIDIAMYAHIHYTVDAMLLSDLKWGGTIWKPSGPVLDRHYYQKEMMMKSLFLSRLLKSTGDNF